MRERLQLAARPFGEALRQLDTLLAEAEPFVDAARKASGEGAAPDSITAREARSLVYLLAYRLGDQEWPAPVAAAVIPAWRDAVGESWARTWADDLAALFLDGYARGREDRVRTHAQRSLAEALPITEVCPKVVLCVAAGPLDADGARAFADRASSYLLRRDARAALLDVEGMVSATPAVLAELWALPSAARMLGVRIAVTGLSGVVGEIVRSSGVREEGETRHATLAEGIDAVLRESGVSLGASPKLGAWMRSLVGAKPSK